MHQLDGRSSPHCCDVLWAFEQRAPIELILTACPTPAACVTALLGPSMIQTTAGLSSSEVRLDRLIMERYMYLPWGPRSFHRNFINRMMHREWRGIRRKERGIFYMTGSTAPSALEIMEHTRHCLSCIFALRQRRCSAAHRFGSRRATGPAKDIIRDTSLISWRRHFTTLTE